MRTTNLSAFRPSLLALEDRTVPATLIEVTHLPQPAPQPNVAAAAQTESPAPAANVMSLVIRPAGRRF